MKGHPKLGLSRGALFKEVNALVASVPDDVTETELLDLLGEPDERTHTPPAPLSGVLPASSLLLPDSDAQVFLHYRDPYRPSRTYVFHMSSSRVVGFTQVSRPPSKTD